MPAYPITQLRDCADVVCNIAFLRTYDVLQADGSINELDVSDLSGRVRTRRVVAGQSGASIGSDAEQSITQYVGW